MPSSIEAPLKNEFVHFAKNESGAPFEKNSVRNWMESQGMDQQRSILAAFGLVLTGCWNRPNRDGHVVSYLVSELETIHNIHNKETRQRLQEGIATRLERIDEKSTSRRDWLHNHRYTHLSTRFPKGNATDAAKDIISSLEDMSTFIDEPTVKDYLKNRINECEDPFWTVFVELSNDHQSEITSFPRLPTFDFLELVQRAVGETRLYPRQPRFDYIESNNPINGFGYVFLGEDRAESIDRRTLKSTLEMTDQNLDEMLGELTKECREKLDWDRKTALFDVESCLCIFAKDPEHRTGGGC